MKEENIVDRFAKKAQITGEDPRENPQLEKAPLVIDVKPFTEEEKDKVLNLLAAYQKKEREGTLTDGEKRGYEVYKRLWREKTGMIKVIRAFLHSRVTKK